MRGLDTATLAQRWEENQENMLCLGYPAARNFGAFWVLTPDLPSHRFNHVAMVSVSDHLAEDVAGTAASYFQFYGIAEASVVISPATRPAALAALLTRRGCRRVAVPVMMHRGAAHVPSPPGGVAVSGASLRERDVFTAILSSVFFPSGRRPSKGMLDRWWQGARELGVRNYVAHLNGTVVGIGTLFCRGGMAGIYNMATLPAYRRRGVARAVIARLLADAYELGCDRVGLTPTEMGRPLYEHVGFDVAYQEHHYILY